MNYNSITFNSFFVNGRLKDQTSRNFSFMISRIEHCRNDPLVFRFDSQKSTKISKFLNLNKRILLSSKFLFFSEG